MKNERKICLFAHYNQQGRVENYVYNYLKSLSCLGFRLIFVSNSPITLEDRNKILQNNPGSKLVKRENTGNDFGAWKWAIDNNLIPDDIDGLLLTNDSVFGPLFSLAPIFENMNAKLDIDFWGLTDSYQGGWHLQSYFLYLTKKVLASDIFKRFFSTEFEKLNKNEIIKRGEISFSQQLKEYGFRGEAFISYKKLLQHKYYDDKHNPTHFFWKELIQGYEFPFIKRELVLYDPEKISNAADIFNVIEEHTNYPIELINEVFIEKFNYNDNKETSPRLLIIAHLFFPDLAFEFIEKLVPLKAPNSFFIFNLSDSLNSNVNFRNVIRRIFPCSIIISAPNKGRDIGGKLSALDLSLKMNIESDITLVIHDKKSPHLEDGNSWRDELFKIIHPRYLGNVFAIFQNNSDVGIVGSEKHIQNEYDKKNDSFSGSNNLQIKEQLKKHAVKTEDYNFVAGNIFWIRTHLVKEFFRVRSILEIRKDLENGNALDFHKGTNVHAWERIMSWIATSQGYKVYGI